MATSTEQTVAKPKLRKPVFTKVDNLKPVTNGHTLTVKVLSADTVLHRGPKYLRLSQCLVGDETGTILFTARNNQVDLMKPGATVILRNAKIDLFRDT